MSKRRGAVVLAAGVIAIAVTAGVLLLRGQSSSSAQGLGYMYSAKFLCGSIPAPPPSAAAAPLAPGDYATSVLVHNFNPTTIQLFKKMVPAPREPDTGAPSGLTPFSVPPDGAFEVDCADVATLAGGPLPVPFAKGFVVLWSLDDFDVEVVLSTRRLGAGGLGMSFDNERLTAQRVEMPADTNTVTPTSTFTPVPSTPTPTPCAGDVDCDSVPDASDNCPTVANTSQTNSDSMNLDGESPANSGTVNPGADATNPHEDAAGDACDPDDDNDGLSDAAEPAGCNGSGALGPTNFDSDTDLFPDGYECANGTNPGLATSRPPYPPTGATDSDGDMLLDSIEKLILTFGGAVNFDGDPCPDGKENASVNADSSVTSADLSLVAQRFGPYRNMATGVVVYAKEIYDFNRDGTIASADLSSVAQRFGPGPAPGAC